MNLYNVVSELRGISEIMDDPEADMDSFALALQDLTCQSASGIKSLAMLIRNKEADIVALRQFIEEKRASLASLESKCSRLREYLLACVRLLPESLAKSPEISVKIRKNPPKVNIFDESLIPAQFVLFKEIKTIDKVGIKQAISSNIVVPGAELTISERLEIK